MKPTHVRQRPLHASPEGNQFGGDCNRNFFWRNCANIEAHGSVNALEKLFRDAAIFLHMDATVDISRFKIVKSLFPHTAGKYAGPE